MSNRDWPEDSEQENGNYVNFCYECGEEFIGNKHRRVCKVCKEESEEENYNEH